MKKALSCAAFLLLGLTPILYGCLPGLFHKEETSALVLALSGLLLACCWLTGRDRARQLSRLDVAVGLWALYTALHCLLHDGTAVAPSRLCQWDAALAGYTLARNLPDRRIVWYALIGAGSVEAVTALLQACGILESGHPYFEVTGHLDNPGPLGGFLAACWTVGFGLLLDKKQSRTRTLLLSGVLLLLSAGLVLADSRAAFLAVACGAVCFLCLTRRLRLHRRSVLIGLAALLCLVGLLYVYRPASAQARLFIWRTSLGFSAEQPLWGHGIGSFQRQYMLRQARYFEAHPSAPEQMVADNTGYPYNETLLALTETGLAGLAFAGFVLLAACGKSREREAQAVPRSALAAWLLFAQFSYPTAVFPLLFAPVCLLGSIESQPVCRLRPGHTTSALLLLGATGLAFAGFYGVRFYRQASLAMQTLHGKDPALDYAATHYECLKNDLPFIVAYHYRMARHSGNPDDRDRLEDIIPSSESYCLLGDYYQHIGLPHEAERAYRTASDMVPTRIMPLYKLWRLYRLRADTVRAVDTARRLVAQPVKVNNSLSINAKRQAREFLDQITEKQQHE